MINAFHYDWLNVHENIDFHFLLPLQWQWWLYCQYHPLISCIELVFAKTNSNFIKETSPTDFSDKMSWSSRMGVGNVMSCINDDDVDSEWRWIIAHWIYLVSFFLTLLGRQGLDWIVGAEYSFWVEPWKTLDILEIKRWLTNVIYELSWRYYDTRESESLYP